MRALFILLFCWTFAAARAQGPSGYWQSKDKSGFFEGLENVEMRLDPSGNGYNGSVYYIWEHGFYYQAIGLQGTSLSGDSVALTEGALVGSRNGVFPGDCRGVFYLHYSHDEQREYLTGFWRKPAGSKNRCPDTQVTFYRDIPPGATWAPPSSKTRRSAPRPVEPVTPAPVAVAQAPLNQDSLRWVSYKSRKDSLEMTIPHHSDTARLELYDDGIVDGDRVSLFMGDSLILKNYELLADAKVMTLHFDRTVKQQMLSLYAENEGEIPPNTALLVIYVDDQRYEVRLSSDMLTNAKVMFRQL